MELYSKLFLLDILIHISFLYTILYCFYFFVAIYEEKDSIVNQLNYNLGNMVRENKQVKNAIDQFKKLPNRDKNVKFIKDQLKKINVLNRTQNQKYTKIATLALVILISVTLLSLVFFYVKYQISGKILLRIITDNILLFAVIGMIEMLFFFFVILRYIPIKNTEFNDMFFEVLNEEIQKRK